MVSFSVSCAPLKTKVAERDAQSPYETNKKIQTLYTLFNLYHCGFLVLGNTQKILTEIWHQFWDKNDGGNYAIEIIFRSHEPFRSYKLTGLA